MKMKESFIFKDMALVEFNTKNPSTKYIYSPSKDGQELIKVKEV
jgi:hypothetical protein